MFQIKNSDMMAIEQLSRSWSAEPAEWRSIRAWLLAQCSIKVRHINAVEQRYCRILDDLSIALYWGRVMRVADYRRCYQNV